MINKIKHYIRKDNVNLSNNSESKISYPPDFSDQEIAIIEWVKPYTMTSPERIVSLIRAINYIIANKIKGDFVECGVWRGGSMMIAARILQEFGEESRKLYLYDTFEGMAAPSDTLDYSYNGESAKDLLTTHTKNTEDHIWAYSPLEEVKNNLYSTGYNVDNIIFIKGKVEDTIPNTIPDNIALLRLDTDWYESTYHELKYLYPKLLSGGILIIDDYGHWSGAQKATDEYIQNNKLRLFLTRMDYTGRLAIKL